MSSAESASVIVSAGHRLLLAFFSVKSFYFTGFFISEP